MQLTYNNQTPLAGGCFEPNDSGISRFGHAVIEEMNRLGMIVDLSHAGRQTCLDAISLSSKPVAISHANPQFFHKSIRNIDEEVLKKDLLRKIQRIRYGKNGYVFISDYSGTFLAHVKPSFVGQNRLEKTDEKGYFTVKGIVDTAKKGEGFISYVGSIKPSTGESAEKTTFVKGFDEWGWAIGSGAYSSDINEDIFLRQTQSYGKNKEQITKGT